VRVLVVAVSFCCLLAGAPRAFAADPTPPADPTTTTAPATTSPPTPSTSSPAPTTTTATAPPSTSVPSLVSNPPADTVATPSAAEQAAARAAFSTLTDAQRALLRRLQDARDRLATARVAALAADADAADATRRATAAQAAAASAQSDTDAAARTLARLRVEIQELAGAVYQHLDRTAPLAEVDTAATIELGRLRQYTMAPSDRLIERVAEAKTEAKKLDTARDETRARGSEATHFAQLADDARARGRQAFADAETADALAITAVTEALGSGAALLTQVADPHFGADGITAALAAAQVGQDDPVTAFGLFRSPVPGAPLGSPYGMRVDPLSGAVGYHPGVDFEAGAGEQIHAAAGGVVVMAGDCGGYGNCVVLDQGHSMATVYAHQSRVLVAVGDRVGDGQVLGLVGSTGKSTGPHLHFEVRFHGIPVDPVPTLTS
jgi:murein DD-endopeptidase MepM/ murein hydrolase activator NlpD